MIFERAERTALADAGLTIGTCHTETGYIGVIRRGREVVIECGHLHTNRDTTTRTSGTSASDCVRELVLAARRQRFADHQAERIATAWQRLGSWCAASAIERAKAEAPTNVAAYRDRVAKIAELLGPTTMDGVA